MSDSSLVCAGRVAAMALLVGVLAAPPASADAETTELQVGTGLILPYAIQPGARLMLTREWALGAQPGEAGWRSGLFAGGEVASYVRPALYTNTLVGGLVGYRLTSPEAMFSLELAVGLAWLGESRIVTVDVDLATGETTDNREFFQHALPTWHTVFGLSLIEDWRWYLDLTAGQTFSLEAVETFYFAIGTGVQITFEVGSGDAR